MKKRYLYMILFGLPGLFVAGLISVVLFGGLAGVLWLYVFGDDPWPGYVEFLLSLLFILSVLTIWITAAAVGYFVGRRLEGEPSLNRSHVLISAGLTFAFLLLILFQQWRVGNLGRRSDSILCSDFCVQHGYSGSGMPPVDSGIRVCSCYDQAGNEVLTIPLDHLTPR